MSNTSVEPSNACFEVHMDKCFNVPLNLKNDIIYCQRAMRDFLKVHSLVIDVFKKQDDADPVQMQRILSELEDEVYEINAEQEHLLIVLNDKLEEFYKKLKDTGVDCVPEIGNEHISKIIVPLIGDTNYKVYPHSVALRDGEDELIRKHFLVSQDDDENSDAATPPKTTEFETPIPHLTLSDSEADGEGEQAKQPQLNIVKKFGDELPCGESENQFSDHSGVFQVIPDDIYKSHFGEKSAVNMSAESDLLKPLNINKQLRSKQQRIPDIRKGLLSPPPLAPISQLQSSVQKQKLDSAGTAIDLAQSRLNLSKVLKRTRKTKQEPRRFDEADGIELINENGTLKKELSKEEHGFERAAGLEAKSTKAAHFYGKSTKQSQSERSLLIKVAKPVSTSLPSSPVKKPYVAQIKQPKGRNAQSARKSDGAGSPPPASSSSDDSNHELQLQEQKRLSLAWNDEPRETRVLPTEYGQEKFLGLFQLYTHDVVKKLNQRHSKRKRRTVQNSNGIDFHYGQQLTALDAIRIKKQKNSKFEFLLSPKEKRLQAKKANKAGNIAGGNRKTKSPDKMEEPQPTCTTKNFVPTELKACKECKKRNDKDNMLYCNACGGAYHSNCHEDGIVKSKQNHSKCPPCLREQISKARLCHLSAT